MRVTNKTQFIKTFKKQDLTHLLVQEDLGFSINIEEDLSKADFASCRLVCVVIDSLSEEYYLCPINSFDEILDLIEEKIENTIGFRVILIDKNFHEYKLVREGIEKI